jgi:hypothetical protein
MNYLKPVSIEEAQNKALPILLAGYKRRGANRSLWERARRAEVKLERDDKRRQEPQISAL